MDAVERAAAMESSRPSIAAKLCDSEPPLEFVLGRPGRLPEERASLAVENDAELVRGHEPIALRHTEGCATSAQFGECQRLDELPDPANVDGHGDGGTGEVLPVLAPGQT